MDDADWDPFFGDYADYIEPINVGPIIPYGENMVVTNITGNDMNDPQFDDPTDDETGSSSTSGFWESLSNAFGNAAGSVLNAAGTAAGNVITGAGSAATGAINQAAGVQTPAQAAAAAQAAQQQKILMLAAGAVALVAVLYFTNRNK